VTTAPPRNDREDHAARPQLLGHEIGDRGDRPRVFHQLAEQGAEQKERKELGEEPRPAAHERLGPVGEDGLARDERRDDRGDRREQKNAPAFEGEPDQDAEADENPQKAYEIGAAHRLRPP